MASLIRPARYAEHHILTAILDGTYPPGAELPNERLLSQKIGVTRPTLRETLQRLSGEGWISIRHGKPTRVNTYWDEGGLKMLGTMAKYGEYLPDGFVIDLLEFRCAMLPPVAVMAVENAPDDIMAFLKDADYLSETPEAFATFDWKLQLLMTSSCPNPIYKLILKDFNTLFKALALDYFHTAEARNASMGYYRDLKRAIGDDGSVIETIVREMMVQSIEIWKRCRAVQDESD